MKTKHKIIFNLLVQLLVIKYRKLTLI